MKQGVTMKNLPSGPRGMVRNTFQVMMDPYHFYANNYQTHQPQKKVYPPNFRTRQNWPTNSRIDSERNSFGELTAIKIDASSNASKANYNVDSKEPINPIVINWLLFISIRLS